MEATEIFGGLAVTAMAVETGQAEVVVVYRSLCQGQFFRFGQAGRDVGHVVVRAPAVGPAIGVGAERRAQPLLPPMRSAAGEVSELFMGEDPRSFLTD